MTPVSRKQSAYDSAKPIFLILNRSEISLFHTFIKSLLTADTIKIAEKSKTQHATSGLSILLKMVSLLAVAGS